MAVSTELSSHRSSRRRYCIVCGDEIKKGQLYWSLIKLYPSGKSFRLSYCDYHRDLAFAEASSAVTKGMY